MFLKYKLDNDGGGRGAGRFGTDGPGVILSAYYTQASANESLWLSEKQFTAGGWLVE